MRIIIETYPDADRAAVVRATTKAALNMKRSGWTKTEAIKAALFDQISDIYAIADLDMSGDNIDVRTI
ncbi:MAG: hypothetical protein PHZ23_14675 [Acidiphilium sp.]|nr:hypothetical protein [Acidiphilium sp.]